MYEPHESDCGHARVHEAEKETGYVHVECDHPDVQDECLGADSVWCPVADFGTLYVRVNRFGVLSERGRLMVVEDGPPVWSSTNAYLHAFEAVVEDDDEGNISRVIVEATDAYNARVRLRLAAEKERKRGEEEDIPVHYVNRKVRLPNMNLWKGGE